MTNTTDETTGDYRVVCERCEMKTGWMPKELAEKARDAHADATGHETEVR